MQSVKKIVLSFTRKFTLSLHHCNPTYLIPIYHLTETVYCGVGKGEQSFPDLCTLLLG